MQDPPESEALRAENARRTQAMRELAVELAHDDPALPVPLDWSDKGPEMTSSPTRELMALMAIWQHHGRPHTPTDRAHIAARPAGTHRAQPGEEAEPLWGTAMSCEASGPGSITNSETPQCIVPLSVILC